jgi:hypothetical protein
VVVSVVVTDGPPQAPGIVGFEALGAVIVAITTSATMTKIAAMCRISTRDFSHPKLGRSSVAVEWVTVVMLRTLRTCT